MFRKPRIALLTVITALLVCLTSYVAKVRLSKQRIDAISSSSPDQAHGAPPPPLETSHERTPRQTASDQERQFINAFATPIDFYGRVVDQHGDPVPDADIKIAANDKAFGGRPTEFSRKTDGNGSFNITGIKGLTLAIEVSKGGYEVMPPADNKVTSSGLFEYGLSSIRGKPESSPEKPIVFTLRKHGQREPLVKIDESDFRVARDGTPLIISLDRDHAHTVRLRCWTNDKNRREGQRKYDWNMEIVAVEGQLAPRSDRFEYEAPEGGYAPTDIINMPASLPQNQWDNIVKRSYFIQFNDGIFARVTLEMHAGGDHFVVWESFLNPKQGSRNLE